jgi:serralysin
MLNLPAGILSDTSTTLQSLEATFQQDLNGNGQIGLVPTTIESFGATRLVQIGSQFFLQDGGGAGPSMKYQGAAYVEGQFGAWTAIGAEQVGSGYQAAFKNGSADQYVVWNLDGNGNYTGNATGAVAGSDATLRALETTFQQDLNGSGLVGSGSGMDQLIQAIAGFPLTASSETVVSSERSDCMVLPLVSNWNQSQG